MCTTVYSVCLVWDQPNIFIPLDRSLSFYINLGIQPSDMDE